jgi:hypothetical protein
MLHMSIAIGESRRRVYARPYFRGRAVCPGADIETGSLLASQTPALPGTALNNPHPADSAAQTGQTVSGWVWPYVDLKRLDWPNHTGGYQATSAWRPGLA